MKMSTPYCWTITRDLVCANEKKSAVGIVGPKGCQLTSEQIRTHKDAKNFRLLDDDQEVYFIGYFVDISGKADEFEPKDDFGEAFGCTEIQYLNDKGVWKAL